MQLKYRSITIITVIIIIVIIKNRILRLVFGPERDGNGERKRLHKEEIRSSYRSFKSG